VLYILCIHTYHSLNEVIFQYINKIIEVKIQGTNIPTVLLI